jgi:hypothetical protein
MRVRARAVTLIFYSGILDFFHASKLISTEVQLAPDNEPKEISKMLYPLIE